MYYNNYRYRHNYIFSIVEYDIVYCYSIVVFRICLEIYLKATG